MWGGQHPASIRCVPDSKHCQYFQCSYDPNHFLQHPIPFQDSYYQYNLSCFGGLVISYSTYCSARGTVLSAAFHFWQNGQLVLWKSFLAALFLFWWVAKLNVGPILAASFLVWRSIPPCLAGWSIMTTNSCITFLEQWVCQLPPSTLAASFLVQPVGQLWPSILAASFLLWWVGQAEGSLHCFVLFVL